MSAVWFLAPAVALLGLAALAVVVTRVADEAQRLGDELRRLRQLRPALLEVRDRGLALQEALGRLRRR